MTKKFIKFQYIFQKLYVYKENIEIKSIFKSETIKKSQIKGTKISSLGTRLEIYVDGHKDIDFSLFDSKKIKDIYKHLNDDLTFDEFSEKYSPKDKETTKSSFFNKTSAKIFGGLLLFFGFVTIFSNFLVGLLILISGVIIFPKTNSLLKEKTKISLTKKNRIVVGLSLSLIAIIILGNSGDSISIEDKTKISNKTEKVFEETDKVLEEKQQVKEETKTTQKVSEPVPEKQVQAKIEPVETVKAYQPTLGEKNALLSANQYLDYSAFSRSGLIKQLEYEGYSSKESEYAISQISVDWNKQASLSAQSYLEYSAFSRSSLIEQLEYEGYTHQQAEYGATSVGY